MVWGCYENILPRIFIHVEILRWKMEVHTRYLCVLGFHVYRDIWEAAEGKMLDLRGCSDGMRHASSPPLPFLKQPELAVSHERLLLPLLRTKVSPLGPVPSLRWTYRRRTILATLGACVTVIITRSYCVRVIYSLLKIFRVKNFRGLSQPRKYFNNENLPNYGISISAST